jgi:benzil reductase ((S)-benzoin forming)
LKLALISGASKGLGLALAKHIASSNEQNMRIIGLSRTFHEDLKGLPGFEWVKADLSDTEKALTSLNAVLEGQSFSEIFFFNNAGVITPISTIGNFEQSDIAFSIQVNVVSPIAIVNDLLKKYQDASRLVLINISSGVANRPIEGWALYCASKAYVKMFFEVLASEQSGNEQLRVIQLDPGVMDTEMQSDIRSSGVESDTRVRLEKAYASGEIKSPDVVAKQILDEHFYETLK